MTEIKQIIAYADDIVLIGTFKLKKLEDIFERYSLKINLAKCVYFRKRMRRIPTIRRAQYLGYGITDTGELYGVCKFKERIKK